MKMPSRIAVLAGLLTATLCTPRPGVAATVTPCDQTVNVGVNLASTIANAPNDSTICLNSGNYGSVSLASINRSGFVTVRSTSGTGATANVNVNSSRFIKLQNLTISGGQV